ncbi:MAG: FmdB family zinc ribbon protein [Legionellales bacterium]
MPIYEYQCTSCHHHFDLMQKMSDPAATQCPECSQHTAIKLVSAAGFQLKGTGWYETDFKNKDSSKKTASDKKEGASTSTATSATTSTASTSSGDSTPATTTTKSDVVK